jgi:SAM-dependent methyltransferase
MKYFVNKYIDKKQLSILDVGSIKIIGEGILQTYRDLLLEENYKGLDIVEGPNVDIVVKDAYNWIEIKNESFDIVISGQAFEHIKYIWLTMGEIIRVLKKDGLVCIIVPSCGPVHRYPVDCWRIFPDGMRALAEINNIEVLECYSNNIEPWKDTVLIGKKK